MPHEVQDASGHVPVSSKADSGVHRSETSSGFREARGLKILRIRAAPRPVLIKHGNVAQIPDAYQVGDVSIVTLDAQTGDLSVNH